jgi:hypothetical protein
MAMANCGAKPQGRPGMARYAAATTINIRKDNKVYLETFMFAILTKLVI